MNNNLSKPTILFHWLTGGAFIFVFCLGLYRDMLPESMNIMNNHKSLGVIVFVIAVLRLLWRFKEGAITSITKLSKVQSVAAKVVHYLLLLATIVMPLSGILMSIGGGRAISVFGLELIASGEKIEWLGSIAHSSHIASVDFIIVILFLHVAGALKHQLIDKDGTLSRMLGR
ncbi:cytochrome b [Psychromonas ossibalaenae]|uniref:cytochrome b n=1 Tax=Psychromonas ossibalaenae TaxID=444922 RepID=UPI00047543E3|nr:cytochrome b [Psychromonas ossibalaenae]